MGRGLAGHVGLCDHQLCLVDRDRIGWNVHLRPVLLGARRVANLIKSYRRDDDYIRRRLRRAFSDPASGTSLAILLAVPVS